MSSVVLRVTVPWARYDLIAHAPQVIALTLASTYETAGGAARNLTDYLGRVGYLSMSDLVAEARSALEHPSSEVELTTNPDPLES